MTRHRKDPTDCYLPTNLLELIRAVAPGRHSVVIEAIRRFNLLPPEHPKVVAGLAGTAPFVNEDEYESIGFEDTDIHMARIRAMTYRITLDEYLIAAIVGMFHIGADETAKSEHTNVIDLDFQRALRRPQHQARHSTGRP